jgi:NAD(P)H-hydrate epimerase
VNFLNELNCFKAAVDVPTGLSPDKGYGFTVFNADLTISLGELKKGLFFGSGYSNCGEIVKGDIGIGFSYFDDLSSEEYLIEPEDALYSLPVKALSAHKYSAGKVLTIAGSGELPGAAVMTSKAALKIGAGSSILCFPKSVRKLIHRNLTEVIVKTYNDDNKEYLSSENISELKDRLKWADTIAIGPGLGRNEETLAAIFELIKKYKKKRLVIDADGIYAMRNNVYKQLNLVDKVLTPHHGEFAALLGIDTDVLEKDILQFGRNFVLETGVYLVLKGAPTIIFLPNGEALINTTGNPGMAKFGTGDVLTGLIAGLLAQQKDIEKALIAAIYLHSLAADLLMRDKTEYSYTAIDILEGIPRAIKFLRKSIA